MSSVEAVDTTPPEVANRGDTPPDPTTTGGAATDRADNNPTTAATKRPAEGNPSEQAIKHAKSTHTPRPMQQTLIHRPFDFMEAATRGGMRWHHMEMPHDEYVPPFNPSTGFAPKRLRDVLVIRAGCGRAKSTQFREYMTRVLGESPHARILLISANILYATNLTAELRLAMPNVDVGYYKEQEDATLSKCQIVVCSLESLHRLVDQRFEMLLIDEVRTIGGLVGGATLDCFENVVLLTRFCMTTPRVVMCDADLLFRADSTETAPQAVDFINLLTADVRPVVCANFTHPGPPHLKRSARLFYDSKEAAKGRDAWLAELQLAALRWHEDHNHRFAICVGSKKQLNSICLILEEMKVPYIPYSGDTRQDRKLVDLQDPDTAWQGVGAIAATTTLSIGVDPRRIQFARVFVWTNRLGCNVLTQFQAAMRFGRSKEAPLLDTTVDILLDCVPPSIQARLVELVKRELVVRPTYDDAVKYLQRRCSSRARMHAHTLQTLGGAAPDARRLAAVTDALIHLMAHGRLERTLQMSCHHEFVQRICEHHGWKINDHGRSVDAVIPVDVSTMPSLATDEDDAFAVLNTQLEKFEWVLTTVAARGEAQFFDDCYGLVARDAEQGSGDNKMLLSRDQFLVKTYWLLQPFGRLPAANDLVELAKPGVPQGLKLNAHRRCFSAEEQDRHDVGRFLLEGRRRMPHPMLKVALGPRMRAADACADLLDVASLLDNCSLPERIIDMVNREAKKKSTDGDRIFLRRLRTTADALCDGEGTLLEVLKRVAKGCGMTCNVERERGTQRGDRSWTVASIEFLRRLPQLMPDYLVRSERLHRDVPLAEWNAVHAALDEEEMLEAARRDEELDTLDEEMALDDEAAPLGDLHEATDGGASGGVSVEDDAFDTRTEKLDGRALAAELVKLRRKVEKSTLTAQEKRWLDWLEDADAHAKPAVMRGQTPPAVRYLTVTYSKRRAIGRRTASHPSSQHCPSTLRPRMARLFYRDADIVNCHPTLFVQVGRRVGSVDPFDLEVLDEYVNHRGPMLQRIADFYRVPVEKCKFGVLRVLNGGSIAAWLRDAKCTHNQHREQDDLKALVEASRVVQEAFFAMDLFKPHVASLTEKLRASRAAKLEQARARLVNARTPKDKAVAEKAVGEARWRMYPHAIKRTVFSLCVFELEDRILDVIDSTLRRLGWTVASLQFDGCHVEHRDDADFGAALRAAERAVQTEMGYTIQLKEKPLFEMHVEEGGEDYDALMDNEQDE